VGILLALLLPIAAYLVAVLIHELGHVIAALLVGWKPIELKVGRGREWNLFRIGDVQFKFGSVPLGGFAQTLAPNASNFRLKQIFVSASGSLTNAGVAILLFGALHGWDGISRLPDWWVQIAIFLIIFNTLCIQNIIFPRCFMLEGRTVSNDARTIWNMVFMKADDVDKNVRAHVLTLFNFYLRKNRLVEVQAILFGKPEYFGTPLDARTFWIHILLREGKKPEALAEIERLLKEGVPSTKHAEVLDSVACISFYHGHFDLLEDSMRYIDEAIAEEPDIITIKGTKGALLIETGRLDEGIAMLEHVLATSTAAVDKAISEYYLAYACHKKGDAHEAMKHLSAAIATGTNCAVRSRIEAEVRGLKVAETVS
jgi:hypothetical protein